MSPARSKGFSLIELMVTLSVAAILLTIAVPSFKDFMQNNRLVTQTNDFITALNLARSEAVKRGTQVTVCKSADQLSCAAAGNWEQGWIVFVDAAGTGAVANPTTDILRVHGPLSSGVTLQGATNLTNYIAYAANGTTHLIGGNPYATVTGLLAMCDSRGFVSQAEGIQISATGRLNSGSLTSIAGASCTP